MAALLGLPLAVAAPVAAWATPTTPHKGSPTTTTTTTKAGKNATAIAKLVIKAASIGHVSVETSGTTTFKTAKDGQSLHVGDTVKTDATGQAEIDYADTAYTRLDVNTQFTIKKLTDDQGNRQVEGSLDVGRTYNRTAALTQSQTFQQDAGGATAAVAGTAFVVTCASASTCTFTAVIDNINLTGAGGATKTLNPLDECVDTNGALCGTTTRLTPDELALIQWIQTNVYLDLVDHGIGDGVFQPFAGTVIVNNGVVQSFTPSAGGTGQGPPSGPSGPSGPTAPSALTINQADPIILDDPGTLTTTSVGAASGTPAAEIVMEDEAANFPDQPFRINASDPNATPQAFSVIFPTLPTHGSLCAQVAGAGPGCLASASGFIGIDATNQNQGFASTTEFLYHAASVNEVQPPVAVKDSFQVQAVSPDASRPPSSVITVPVTINENPVSTPGE